MVPSATVLLDKLPRAASGKVDRRALPAPVTDRGAAGGRAPRSEVEAALCALFAEVLGVETVTIDDSFFDLGGHSLAAARLASRIRTVLGLDASVRSLFDTPTVAGLLDGSGGGRDPLGVLLPLRDQGDRPPLFCLPPFTGLSWCYSALVGQVAAGRPVYGLQSPRLREPDRPAGSVDEIAREFLDLIRGVQPHGPYHLLGWSFGGLVAHAVATRLQQEGERVGLLALLDAYPSRPGEAPEAPGLADALSLVVGDGGYDPAVAGELARLAGPAELARYVHERNPSLAGLDGSEIAALAETARGHLEAMARFVPGRFRGDVAFYLATEGRPDGAPSVDRWRDHVYGDIDVHEIRCTHWQLAEPGPLGEVARTLAGKLA
jgi:thioesterase domain-containing protein/acyl carrier protein